MSRKQGVSFNYERRKFIKSSLLLAYIGPTDMIRSDPAKAQAIKRDALSNVTQPLMNLVQNNGIVCTDSIACICIEWSEQKPVPALYDPNRQKRVSADTSFYGIGVVLL